MSSLTRDGTAEPVSLDQILRRERGQGKINFPCSVDQDKEEEDWQPYPVNPYTLAICVTIHTTYIHTSCPLLILYIAAAEYYTK